MTGGQALVESLVAHSVDTVFGIPGTHNLEIYRHLRQLGVRHIGTRHEQGAGYAADGYARVAGRPGVAVVTTGPAVLNAAAALGQSYSDSVPVLLVSPGMPLRHPGRGNGLLHETKDQSQALGHVAAYSHRVTSVAEIPVAVAQAFAAMTSGRPRPVHLEIPLDVLLESGDASVVPPILSLPSEAPGDALDATASRLVAARLPVVIAGGGARRAADPVRRIAEHLAAPVLTTANGKGVVPEDHPLSLGAGLHLPAVRSLVSEADVVLVIGSELAPSDLWYGPLPLEGKLVRIDIDPDAVLTNAVPDVAVVGDAALSVVSLVTRLETTRAGNRLPGDADPTRAGNRSLGDDRSLRAQVWRERKAADSRAEGADWLEIVAALSLPRDAIVAADSAMVCYYGALANLPIHRSGGFLYPTGFGTLGYGLPAAIGAKVADPGAPVVVLIGDGGLMFTMAELATAAALRLPLPVVVVDNAGYGEIEHEMIQRGDPVHAVAFESPDFAALGRSMGCAGVTLDGAAGLSEAVAEAFTADRPTVIHVRDGDR